MTKKITKIKKETKPSNTKLLDSKFKYQFIKAKKSKLGTIVFVHGFCVEHSYFVCAEQVAEHYDYYGIDLPGHGLNTISNDKKEMKEKLSFDNFTNYVCDFIKSLNLDKINLIGHSMGGGVVALVANKIPEKINKLVMISPMNFASIYTAHTFSSKFFPKTFEEKMEQLPCLYKDYHKLENRKGWMDMVHAQFDFQTKNWDQMKYLGKRVMASPCGLFKVHKAQKHLSVPTMLCLGKSDGIIPFKQTLRNFKNHEQICFYAFFEESGHLCFEEETDKFIQNLYTFLK